MPSRIEADVLATYGRGVLLGMPDGSRASARPHGRRLSIVCGDRVACEQNAHGELLVREVLPRRSALWRTNGRGESEVVAANLDLLCIVFAPVPRPDPFVIDRYLCAAESASLGALLVMNKCDLERPPGLDEEIAQYSRLGYDCLAVGARAGLGLDTLASRLEGRVGALVGQSGVGKSSLIRRLAIDGGEAATGELIREEEGRHTTTTSRRYTLPGGAALIDSPGVRDYAPSIDHLDSAQLGFVEIAAHAPGCRFLDCRHLEEPRCAVREAVDSGAIAARRYESYRRLRRLRNDLEAMRPRGRGGGRPPG